MDPLEAELFEQFIDQGLNDDDARYFAREWVTASEPESETP